MITISALEHPNIAAQIAGQPKPYPKAIDLAWVEERVKGDRPWCTPIAAGDATITDLEWPPGSGSWYTPVQVARLLGWTRQYVTRLCARKQIHARRVPGMRRWLIDPVAVERLLRERRPEMWRRWRTNG